MGKYLEDRQGKYSKNVEEIKEKVSIPKYFEKIIVPALGSYFSDYPADFEGSLRTLCPLHDEDTPSFYYRPNLGTYKCFGCGAYGDVIALHRNFTEKETGEVVSFEDALSFLRKVFIEQGDISAVQDINKFEQIDSNELTYINSLYARAITNIVHSGKDMENKLEEVRALREALYFDGKSVVQDIEDGVRGYVLD